MCTSTRITGNIIFTWSVTHCLTSKDLVHRVIDLSRDITEEIANRTRILHNNKMTSLGKLSASVVHEINNPLTGILNFTKLMQRTLKNWAPPEAELDRYKIIWK